MSPYCILIVYKFAYCAVETTPHNIIVSRFINNTKMQRNKKK